MYKFFQTKQEYLYPHDPNRFKVTRLSHIPGEDWPYKYTSLEAICIVDTFRELKDSESIVINGEVFGTSKYRILQGIHVYDNFTCNHALNELNTLVKEMNAQFNFHYYLDNH